jgi:hypothetical protein
MWLINHASFRQFCAECGKRFRRLSECFVGAVPTKQFGENSCDFNELKKLDEATERDPRPCTYQQPQRAAPGGT